MGLPLLLDAVTEDTVGTPYRLEAPCSVYVFGTFGNGTVTLSASPTESGTYVPIKAITAAGAVNVDLIGRYWLKATLSGSTNPTITARTG
jgi:hypothetical protein